MKTFKDNSGRVWTVDVNVDCVKRVKSLININLMDVIGGDLLQQLSEDPILLCNILYAICKPEAEAQNVTDEEFGRALGGDSIEFATNAFMEALVDFFPSRKRRALKKVLQKMDELEIRVMEAAEAALDSPKIENQIQDALNDISGFAGKSADNSASILENTRLES